MENDFIGNQPHFTYARFDLQLIRDTIDTLKLGISEQQLAALTAMDDPSNMPILKELAEIDALGKVSDTHFPKTFDLI